MLSGAISATFPRRRPHLVMVSRSPRVCNRPDVMLLAVLPRCCLLDLYLTLAAFPEVSEMLARVRAAGLKTRHPAERHAGHAHGRRRRRGWAA
jgi:hypothetical protein